MKFLVEISKEDLLAIPTVKRDVERGEKLEDVVPMDLETILEDANLPSAKVSIY